MRREATVVALEPCHLAQLTAETLVGLENVELDALRCHVIGMMLAKVSASFFSQQNSHRYSHRHIHSARPSPSLQIKFFSQLMCTGEQQEPHKLRAMLTQPHTSPFSRDVYRRHALAALLHNRVHTVTYYSVQGGGPGEKFYMLNEGSSVPHTQGTTRLEPKCQAGTRRTATRGHHTTHEPKRVSRSTHLACFLLLAVFHRALRDLHRRAYRAPKIRTAVHQPRRENPTGLPCLLGSFGAEDPYPWFGEMALVSNAPRSAACIALEPTKLLSLAKADFPAFLQIMPSFSQVPCLLTVNTHFPLSQPDRHTLTFLRG